MERLTKKLEGGIDAFGTPKVTTYEIDLQTATGRIKARCALGRYEDLNRTPEELAADLAELDKYREIIAAIPLDRLEEICKAEREGRLKILFGTLEDFKRTFKKKYDNCLLDHFKLNLNTACTGNCLECVCKNITFKEGKNDNR